MARRANGLGKWWEEHHDVSHISNSNNSLDHTATQREFLTKLLGDYNASTDTFNQKEVDPWFLWIGEEWKKLRQDLMNSGEYLAEQWQKDFIEQHGENIGSQLHKKIVILWDADWHDTELLLSQMDPQELMGKELILIDIAGEQAFEAKNRLSVKFPMLSVTVQEKDFNKLERRHLHSTDTWNSLKRILDISEPVSYINLLNVGMFPMEKIHNDYDRWLPRPSWFREWDNIFTSFFPVPDNQEAKEQHAQMYAWPYSKAFVVQWMKRLGIPDQLVDNATYAAERSDTQEAVVVSLTWNDSWNGEETDPPTFGIRPGQKTIINTSHRRSTDTFKDGFRKRWFHSTFSQESQNKVSGVMLDNTPKKTSHQKRVWAAVLLALFMAITPLYNTISKKNKRDAYFQTYEKVINQSDNNYLGVEYFHRLQKELVADLLDDLQDNYWIDAMSTDDRSTLESCIMNYIKTNMKEINLLSSSHPGGMYKYQWQWGLQMNKEWRQLFLADMFYDFLAKENTKFADVLLNNRELLPDVGALAKITEEASYRFGWWALESNLIWGDINAESLVTIHQTTGDDSYEEVKANTTNIKYATELEPHIYKTLLVANGEYDFTNHFDVFTPQSRIMAEPSDAKTNLILHTFLSNIYFLDADSHMSIWPQLKLVGDYFLSRDDLGNSIESTSDMRKKIFHYFLEMDQNPLTQDRSLKEEIGEFQQISSHEEAQSRLSRHLDIYSLRQVSPQWFGEFDDIILAGLQTENVSENAESILSLRSLNDSWERERDPWLVYTWSDWITYSVYVWLQKWWLQTVVSANRYVEDAEALRDHITRELYAEKLRPTTGEMRTLDYVEKDITYQKANSLMRQQVERIMEETYGNPTVKLGKVVREDIKKHLQIPSSTPNE